MDPAHRERMERMKLPVPNFGQNPSQRGDDKKGVSGRKKSEDSLVEMDQKPAGFGNQHGYRDDLPYEYHSDEDCSYEGGVEGNYKQEQQGEQYYDVNDGYDGLYEPDDDRMYPRYHIKQEQVDDMWRDETPSVSDRNFNDGYNEPSSPPAPLRMTVPERSKSANTFRPKPLPVATKNGFYHTSSKSSSSANRYQVWEIVRKRPLNRTSIIVVRVLQSLVGGTLHLLKGLH